MRLDDTFFPPDLRLLNNADANPRSNYAETRSSLGCMNQTELGVINPIPCRKIGEA